MISIIALYFTPPETLCKHRNYGGYHHWSVGDFMHLYVDFFESSVSTYIWKSLFVPENKSMRQSLLFRKKHSLQQEYNLWYECAINSSATPWALNHLGKHTSTGIHGRLPGSHSLNPFWQLPSFDRNSQTTGRQPPRISRADTHLCTTAGWEPSASWIQNFPRRYLTWQTGSAARRAWAWMFFSSTERPRQKPEWWAMGSHIA